MDASRRWCRRCGSALSRYNREVHCAACSRAPTAVPASLWELARIRQALRADDVGGVLVAARAALGLSQAGLAGLLSDESVTFSQAKVSRIEAGLAVKDIDDRRRISDVLGIPAELLGLASGRSFARASLALRPRVTVTAEEATVPMERRNMLTGAAALIAWTVGRPWTELSGQRIGPAHVQQAEDALAQFRALDDRYGGDGIHELAAGTWQRVQALLDHGSYDGETGQRLRVVAGRLAEQAGWLSFDAGRQDQARYYLTEALTAARTADDADLEMLALGSLSLQASRLGRLREAVAFAQRVQESPAARRTPVAVVMAATREARGHALGRDPSAAIDAMLWADKAFSRAGNRPDRFAYLDEAQLAASHGYCWAALGRPDKAVPLFAEAVEHHRDGYRRNHALWSGYLARAHFAAGDLDRAAAVGLTALAANEQVTSARAGEQIAALRDGLAAHPGVAVAREYVERFDNREVPAGAGRPAALAA